MAKICVMGAFRLWDTPKGGQEVKTWIITDALEEKYGKVYRIDTLSKYGKALMLFQLVWALLTCRDIIILPAHNGLITLSLLLSRLNSLFGRKLHYVVIGGWLQDVLPNHPIVIKALKDFNGIYVETTTMMNALIKIGLQNVFVMPNCKPLQIKKVWEMSESYKEPYRLVTFSRVTEKKGIGTAVDLVMSLNRKYGRDVFSLDIYGSIDAGEDECWFAELQKRFTSAIHYKGNAPFDKSVEYISEYFALLFPTQFYTEGIPGTIIDAYAAGVPVISAKWKSYDDVVEEGVTGLGYEFNNNDAFRALLEQIFHCPSKVWCMKQHCIQRAETFIPKNAMLPLFSKIEQI